MRPKISVVAVSYNGGKRIVPTLESIRLQNSKEKELIIADDCSDDNGLTVKIIEKWLSMHEKEFLRIVFLKNKQNLGIVANLYNAAQSASGDVIMFNGQGDTLYSKNTLNEVADEIEAQRCSGLSDPYFWLGQYRAYSMANGSFQEVELNKDLPAHHALIEKNPILALRRNLLIWDIGGVGTVFNSRFFEEKYFPLKNAPRNWEDGPTFLWALIEGKRIGVLPVTLRWYEIGVGISWSKEKIPFFRRLVDRSFVDEKNVEKIYALHRWVSELKPANPILKKITRRYIKNLDFQIAMLKASSVFEVIGKHKMGFIRKVFQKIYRDCFYNKIRKLRNRGYQKETGMQKIDESFVTEIFNKKYYI
ncbi:MAG: glycosyltransferase family 2 protein [Crenarchaeota archaeon]|jgi:glycosyltransferase involved in cell wall biosynthesis|nr:glycosyltransferase family 2 protein [Thermoproteota archaeon]